MKHLVLGITVLLATTAAYAKKECTTEPKEKWMSEADFKKQVEGQGDDRLDDGIQAVDARDGIITPRLLQDAGNQINLGRIARSQGYLKCTA